MNKKSLKIPITTLKSAQAGFKKRQIETLKLNIRHIALDKVDFWFQDETRIAMQDTTTRLCLMNGRRPRAVKQQQLTMRGIIRMFVWCCALIHR